MLQTEGQFCTQLQITMTVTMLSDGNATNASQSTYALRCFDVCSPFPHESAFDMRQFRDNRLRDAHWDLRL